MPGFAMWSSSRVKQSNVGTDRNSRGIATSSVRMIAREQQFAEKIHAYTLLRSAQNSRVKDLVDLALLTRRSRNQAGSESKSWASVKVPPTPRECCSRTNPQKISC